METYPAFRSSTLRIVPPPAARAVDATTLYAPPYSSALADGFAWNLVKYLAPAFDLSVDEYSGGTVVTLTAPATRPGRPPRYVTFVFAHPELKGEGEEPCTFLEEAADDVPPGVLYVLRPEDIVHRLPDVLALVAKWDPALFSTRGAVNLERLSSDEARSRRVTPTCTEALVSYLDERSASCLLLDTGIPVPETLVVQRVMRPRSSPPASPAASAQAPVDTPPGSYSAESSSQRRYARSA